MLPTPHRVAVLAFDGVVLFDLASACHVFGTAGASRYAVTVCGPPSPGPLHVAGGDRTAPVGLHGAAGLEALAQADTIVVPGVGDVAAPVDGALLAALRAATERGARVASICTGAFVLAAAGLLDGRRATTHWSDAAELARRFPAIRVEPDVLYVDEGPVLTSAGVAAGIDLCLHLVRADHGVEVAGRVARRMVVPPHRDGGQAQYVDRPLPPAADTGLAATRTWMLDRLAAPLTVEAMAAHASVSPRTFARRFRAETGTTPLRWIVRERIAAAQRLLETTDLDVESVATRSGFGTAAGLREHFRRACATTPTAYRATFRGPRPAP